MLAEWVRRAERVAVVRVVGECMQPRVAAGSLAHIDVGATPRPGDLVLAEVEDGLVIKELHEWDGATWLVAIRGPAPRLVAPPVMVLGVVTMVTHPP